MTIIEIRAETAVDIPAIHQVNALAFDSPAEANLVDALRQRGAIVASLVAWVDGQVVGHILFSPVSIVAEDEQFTAVKGSMLKVKGSVRATAIVMVMPGMAPQKVPMATPPKTARIFLKVKK